MEARDCFFRRWRRWILGAALLLVLVIAPVAMVLAGDGVLEFIDANPLALKYPPEPVYYVALKNTGDEAAEGITFRVVALQGPKGESLGDEVLLVEPSPGTIDTLKANSVGTFKLAFTVVTETVVLSNGTYSGFLAAEAPGVDPVHRPLTLQVGEQVGEAATLAFVDQGSLQLKHPFEPVPVALNNTGDGAVEGIDFRVMALQDPTGRALGDDVLHVESSSHTLKANSVGTFELTFSEPETVTLSDGTHSGFLVAKAPGIDPVLRPLTLEVGKAGSLAFLDTASLDLKGPPEPVLVALKNTEEEAVEGIDFHVMALQGPGGESLGDDVLHVESSSHTLKANSVGTFELTFTETVGLLDGTYSGFLVAEARGVDPVPRPLTWESRVTLARLVPEADALATVCYTEFLSPLRRLWSSLCRSYTLPGANIESLTEVLLYGEDVAKLNPDQTEPVSTTLRTEQGQEVIATLHGFVKRPSDAELEATLSLSGLTGPGKYTGSLMLDPTDPGNTKKLAITVSARDCWLWPLIVTFVGVVLSYLVLTLWGRKRLGWQIESQALVALAEIKEDHKRFICNPKNKPLKGYTIVAGPWKPVVDILEYIQELLKLEGAKEKAKKDRNVVGVWKVTRDQNRIRRQLQQRLGDFKDQFSARVDKVKSVSQLLKDAKLEDARKEAAELLLLVAGIAETKVQEIQDLIAGGKQAEAQQKLQALLDGLTAVVGQVKSVSQLLEDGNLEDARQEAAELLPLVQGVSDESAEREVGAIQYLIAQGKRDEAQKKLDALLAYFAAYQTFRGSAKSLHNSYKQLQEELNRNREDSEPSLQKAASKLFPGRPVQGPGDLAGLATQVADLRGFYALFVRIYDRWELGSNINLGTIPSGSDDEAMWKRARARLKGGKRDLWAAGSAQEVVNWRVEPMVEWALGRLRELQEKYPPPPPSPPPAGWSPTMIPPAVSAMMNRLRESLAGVRPALRSLDLSQAPPEELRRYALRITRFIKRGEVFLTLFGLLVAVGTAMWALYAIEPFGTGWDYLALFVWGSGVDQSLKGFSAVLGKLGIGQA